MNDWKTGFHRAMIDALISQASPLDDNPSFYGWIADNWEQTMRRVRNIGIDYDRSTYEDSDWDEFQGTFYEGDTRKHGVDITLVLNDGSTARYRWSGQVGDLITQVARSG